MPNVGKIFRNGRMMEVPYEAKKGLQSVLFSVDQWSPSEVRMWLRRHGLFENFEEMGKFYHAR